MACAPVPEIHDTVFVTDVDTSGVSVLIEIVGVNGVVVEGDCLFDRHPVFRADFEKVSSVVYDK